MSTSCFLGSSADPSSAGLSNEPPSTAAPIVAERRGQNTHNSSTHRRGAWASPADVSPADVSPADVSLCEALRGLRLWLLLFILFAQTGGGLVVINNLPQIAIALDPSAASGTAVFVSLLSVANCLGRMTTGLLSSLLSSQMRSSPRLASGCPPPFAGCPPPQWLLLLNVLLMGGAQLYLAFASYSMLFIGVLFVGYPFGAIWAVTSTPPPAASPPHPPAHPNAHPKCPPQCSPQCPPQCSPAPTPPLPAPH